jgi:outer membrane lipoprotein carrier protein LolA
MTRARRAILGWLVASIFLPHAVRAEETWTLPQLMEALAAVTEVDATFSERKELTVLETPLLSTGTLHYRAPAAMEKEVLYPEPMRYAITSNRIIIDQPGGEQKTFPLDQYPLLRVLSESMRATLAGDQATLERFYRLAFSTEPGEWTLRLEPIDPDIAKRVTAIIISGSGNQVLRVETLESGGDRSVMTISPTVR